MIGLLTRGWMGMSPQARRLSMDASRTQMTHTELEPTVTDGHRRTAETSESPPYRTDPPAWKKWLKWLVVLLTVLVAMALVRWWGWHAQNVTLMHPTLSAITETISSSGRVRGVTETVVGAQAAGIVETLYVDEGDRVTAGQALAVLKHDVAEARVSQAEQVLSTAHAQLAQVERGPLSSEVETAQQQVRQAEAQLVQQRAAVQQAQQSVAQSRAQLHQLQAELNLAATQLERSAALFERNYISRAEYDQTQTQFRVAEGRVTAAQQAVAVARANVQEAEAGVQAAQANVKALEARLRTVQNGATPEEIEVARQRVAEAEHALRVARQQVQEAVVTAPFAGIITALNAELGQPVGTQGVVRLVSSALEIRLDVDESNLADLVIGQQAVISSSVYPNDTFRGSVSEIGAAVDQTRGTVTVRVTPLQAPDWLRPGQTVNVNIITQRAVPRLLIPAQALNRSGERVVVYVVENGRALEKVVLTRPPTPEGVPVLTGLRAEDRIIADARGLVAGERVRVRR
jgi:HlyD family secretion protein